MIDNKQLIAIHDELLKEYQQANERLKSFVRFMEAVQVPALERIAREKRIASETIATNGRSDKNAIPEEEFEDLGDPSALSLSGMSVPEALVVYAQEHDNHLNCTKAARALMQAGVGNYASVESAFGSFYYHLKKDPRWTKTGPGEFTFSPKHHAKRKITFVS